MYESKNFEFNDVSSTSLQICLITDETKVLLYNFFEDSTATLDQWRLVLNGDVKRKGRSGIPTFDETRHVSIYVEVRCLQPKLSFPQSLTICELAAEVIVRCNYLGSEKPLDHGQFHVS